MTHRAKALAGSPLALIFLLGACGGSSGGDGQTPPEGAAIRTLAYVVTQCHEDAPTAMTAGSGQPAAFSFSQTLNILRDDRPAVTVAAIPTVEGPALGVCPLYASFYDGTN